MEQKWKLWDQLEFEIVLASPDEGHGGGCRDIDKKKNEYDTHVQIYLIFIFRTYFTSEVESLPMG